MGCSFTDHELQGESEDNQGGRVLTKKVRSEIKLLYFNWIAFWLHMGLRERGYYEVKYQEHVTIQLGRYCYTYVK